MIHVLVIFKVKDNESEKARRVVDDFIHWVDSNEKDTFALAFAEEESRIYTCIFSFASEEAKTKHDRGPYNHAFFDIMSRLSKEEPVNRVVQLLESA